MINSVRYPNHQDPPIKKEFLLLITFLVPLTGQAVTITYQINAGGPVSVIPSEVYGSDQIITNNNASPTTLVNKITLYRQGGNRMTAYSWENNASNAGTDYGPNHEDWYMVPNGVTAPGMPATTITAFVGWNNSHNAESLITLQMAGYASANGACNCVVTVTGAADSTFTYWKQVVNVKGGPLSLTPNTSDSSVYMDEEMNFLVNTLGTAGSTGAKFYDLDNEPALWSGTHPLVHPAQPTCAEVSSKGVSLSNIITQYDPSAQVLGPVAYGWSEYVNNQSAPDYSTTAAGYNNGNGIQYLNYYLSQFNSASTTAGRRLLHYLDLHWYPEATGSNGVSQVRITNDQTTYGVAVARMQAPRSLWDPTYVETSWITSGLGNKPITLIPRLQNAVSQYYPGTKLSFSEYQYGSGEDISGGVAQADALGILGQYGVMACRWDDGTANTYVAAAYNLYLNYDSAGASFGNLSMPATSSSVTLSSVYASRNDAFPNKLWVLAVNRDFPSPGNAVTDTGSFTVNNLNAGQSIIGIRAFRFDPNHSAPTSVAAPTFSGNTFTDNAMPGRSGIIYELTLSQSFITMTPTPSGPTKTPTSTQTGTASSTPTKTATATASKTPTSTPTNSATPSPTFSYTPSPTVTSTPTQTPSSTQTGTPTASPTGTLPTYTFTPSATPTDSQTNSPTSTPTGTPTGTPTLTSTNTTTATPTQTGTSTWTTTFTATPTSSFTKTSTSTFSSTPTSTYSSTPTTTPTITWTPTITLSPTPSFTPSSGSEVSLITIFNNPIKTPGPAIIQFTLKDPADSVVLKIFSTAFRKVKEADLGSIPAGVTDISLDLSDDHGNLLANGLYYVVVTVGKDKAVGKMLLIR